MKKTIKIIVILAIIVSILAIGVMSYATTNPSDKKTMIPYIVGAILIFASTAIVGVVYDMASSLNTSTTGTK